MSTLLKIINSYQNDKNNQVILRSTSSKVSNQGANNLAFYTRVPSQASQLTLIARPWRKQDGEIIVHSIDLGFL